MGGGGGKSSQLGLLGGRRGLLGKRRGLLGGRREANDIVGGVMGGQEYC